jgi:hypothetical protein
MGHAIHAQSKFYVMPTFGMGVSNVTQRFAMTDFSQTGVNRSNKIDYNAKVLVGYRLKKWRIESGLQYGITGYNLKRMYFGTGYPDIQNSSASYRYQHLNIPLQFSRQIPVYEDCYIVPIIGVAAGFNLGEKYTSTYEKDIRVNKTSDAVFDYKYNRMSLWATTGFNFEYNINRKIAVVAGPAFQYMLTNLMKDAGKTGYYTAQHNYSIEFNAGIKVNLL